MTTLNVYAHVPEERDERAAKVVGEILGDQEIRDHFFLTVAQSGDNQAHQNMGASVVLREAGAAARRRGFRDPPVWRSIVDQLVASLRRGRHAHHHSRRLRPERGESGHA